MAADVQIERIDTDISGTSGTITLLEDVGDVTSAFIRVMGASSYTSAGPTGSTANTAPNVIGVLFELTDTDEITYTKLTTDEVKVMLEVWRYTGAASGDYEFISRERGTLSSGSATTKTGVITSATHLDNCIPFHCGVTNTGTTTSDFEGIPCYITVNATDELVVGRNNTSGTITASYDLVEFTGSAWSVGHSSNGNHDTMGTTGIDIPLNQDKRGHSGASFDVTDWETAIIMQATMGGDSAETGIGDINVRAQPAAATTEVNISYADVNARNDSIIYVRVLQCDDLVVKRDTNTGITEGNGSYGTALSMPSGVNASTDLSELSLEWFVGTSGVGAAHSRGMVHAKIEDNSGYEIQHWVHRSGNNVSAFYGVADLSALEVSTGLPRRFFTIT